MTVDGYAETIPELSQQIMSLFDSVHSHMDGVQTGLQGSVDGVVGSISGLNSSLGGLQSNLDSVIDGGFTGVHDHLDNLSSIGSNDNSLTLFESLNGSDGSLADGTPVTVVNRDGAFKVLASRNFFNDSKDSQNMLIYLLERTDLEHKPTMLVADVYVNKVVIP